MAEGRSQTTMEVWPISRHLEAFQNKYKRNSQCVFIAPSIFKDSERQIAFVKSQDDLNIRSYKIDEFIDYLDTTNELFLT